MLNVALNAIVRMTVRTCLFTLAIGLNFILIGPAQGARANHELPFNVNELIEIPESADTSQTNRREIIGQSNCQLFFRSQFLRRDQFPGGSTCPVESIISANRNSTLSTKPVWSAIGQFASSNHHQLSCGIERLSQTAGQFHGMIHSSAVAQFRSFASHVLPPRPLESARKRVPAILSAYGRATGIELTDVTQSHSRAPESLIKFTGNQQDPYWQYYDDCDRWGVEFTILLNEAHTVDTSVCSLNDRQSETVAKLNSDSDHDSSRSRFSITRFLISQNVGSWLETSHFEKQVSISFLEWLRVTEFNSVESTGIDSGLFEGPEPPPASVFAKAARLIGSGSVRLSLFDQIESISIKLKNLPSSIRAYSANRPNQDQTSIASGRTTQSK